MTAPLLVSPSPRGTLQSQTSQCGVCAVTVYVCVWKRGEIIKYKKGEKRREEEEEEERKEMM